MKSRSQPAAAVKRPGQFMAWGLVYGTLRLLPLVFGLFLSPLAQAEEVVIAARVVGDDQRTRFIADLTGPRSYSVYVLPNPYRVMIDLGGVKFNLAQGSGQKTRGLVREYRYGELEKGKSRLVLDTVGPVLIEKSFVVKPQAGQPARIVVDMVKTSEAAFLAAYHKDNPDAAPPQTQDEPKAAPQLADGQSAEEDIIAQEISQQEAPISSESAAAPPENQVAALPPEAIVPPVTAQETVPPPQVLQAPQASQATPAAPASEEAAPGVPPPAKKNGKRVIVIDPGHGGIDPGASSPDGVKEKTVVLDFANALRQALERSGRYEVVLTRADDSFLRLRHRVEVARQHQADLFIAIHADTVRGQDARGATIYTLSDKASDAEAEALASKENRADIIGAIDLEVESKEITNILIDLAQRESKNHAMLFSKKALSQLQPITMMTGKPIRSAGFVVLKAPDVPSVLLELGYLSSKEDVKLLTSPAWQTRTAKALATAIDGYFATELAQRSE